MPVIGGRYRARSRGARLAYSLTCLLLALAFCSSTANATQALSGGSVHAPTIRAADAFGCPESSFCMWQNIGFSGTRYTYTIEANNQNKWLYVGSAANDQASSIDSNRVHSTQINKDFNPIGSNGYCLTSGFIEENLTLRRWPDGSNMNDSISAYELRSENPC
ncbi:MAG TPA: peptidase inhibitor family I36 protein [Conexibacter sp.]|nr:peptidase inhibitor family I36 protein [Conexibacter sp.]